MRIMYLERVLKSFIIVLTAVLAVSFIGCGGRSLTKIDPVFYPPLPQHPKVQYLKRYKHENDLGKKTSNFEKFITGEQESSQTLVKPQDVAFYDNKLYVVDSRRGEVIIMNLITKDFSVLAEGTNIIEKPMSIFITSDGLKYIADNKSKKIHLFDKNDMFVRSFGEDNQFSPTSVSIYGKNLYVSDVKDHEIEVLNRFTGDFITSINGAIKVKDPSDSTLLIDSAAFAMPAYLTTDSKGNLYASDMLNGVVKVFDTTLNYVKDIGYPGDIYGSFSRPRGIAVGPDGLIYVVDAGFENVQLFSQEGELLLFFGGPGVNFGNMYLPAGIKVIPNNFGILSSFFDDRFKVEYLILVANQYGPNGVSIYAFGDGDETAFKTIVSEKDLTNEKLDGAEPEN